MKTLRGKLQEYGVEMSEELDNLFTNPDDEVVVKFIYDFDGLKDINVALYQRVKVPVKLEDENEL